VDIAAVGLVRAAFPDAQINLITMNTPVRDDYQIPEKLLSDDKFLHYNYYIHTDKVQVTGGYKESGKISQKDVGKKKSVLGAPRGFLLGKTLGITYELAQQLGMSSDLGGERGTAERTYNNGKTINIGFDNQYHFGISTLFNIKHRHRLWMKKHADLLLGDLRDRATTESGNLPEIPEISGDEDPDHRKY
jgi:hypothetical protein